MSARAIQPLCYEHHVPMALPDLIVVAPDLVTYTCTESGCPRCYRISKGYFLAATEGNIQGDGYVLPRVVCPVDSHPMYLGETQREHLSYRLWRCPKCGASKVGGDLPMNSL